MNLRFYYILTISFLHFRQPPIVWGLQSGPCLWFMMIWLQGGLSPRMVWRLPAMTMF